MASNKNLLPFISNRDLFAAVKAILDVAQFEGHHNDENIFRNSIDPFSALFDAALQKISLKEWLLQEEARQIQKTLQNDIGYFHQSILGFSPGWENLETGSVIDIRNRKRKIIAEIKNKYNTTKGNHKTAIYDDLKGQLHGEHKGYIAYYVEIIPKSKKTYDVEFTPSDNRTKTRRPVNKNIRVIDGKTFYDLATGHTDSLKGLYEVLPIVISDVLGIPLEFITNDKLFAELFGKIY